MDSLIFAINAIAPIVALIAIGYLLKRIGWIKADYARVTNKLVFHVFLPVMLFLNVLDNPFIHMIIPLQDI